MFDSKTARFLAIKEIAITQGAFVGRIDINFFDDPELNRINQVCQLANKRECTDEQDHFTE